jgi:hypothetical protein
VNLLWMVNLDQFMEHCQLHSWQKNKESRE